MFSFFCKAVTACVVACAGIVKVIDSFTKVVESASRFDRACSCY